MNVQSLSQTQLFLREVKNGNIRGDYIQEAVTDNVFIEVSVGPFEFGTVELRVFVEDERIKPSDNYYQSLYKYDTKYQEIQEHIVSIVESENETEITNSHTWDKEQKQLPPRMLPEDCYSQKTTSFIHTVKLRDDVTIVEAMETNSS
jgi:hypothetical protein